ncbi:Na(+)/H(+) antiporter subunit F1 [Paenibacillus sp. PAMC21692]|uniref:Na(+)/H(+) antiporter subunit F1 n=1 Tax=Paenibacillus sp. PAMC21692 TaxID=2762320 RepID=UPI00164EAC42|nr:Na(+)/H(+) antiporter subunit F1 [Paenibacillus sp. PAMC21692]QNK57130.1 Na(+)/H(+) antiporter subunit F1 [Paenibacillus sp. PAMC21692]
MFQTLLMASIIMLTISISIALYRVIRGPSLPDRILALDSIGYNIIGIVAVLCMMLDSSSYLETILLIGILAFLSTVALCKFLERGVVIDRNRND